VTVDSEARATRRTRRRRPVLRAAVLAALALGIFVLGVALGEAIESNPKPGPAETRVHTIVPLASTRVTVTVTTTVTGGP
jgi:hypothetical protein